MHVLVSFVVSFGYVQTGSAHTRSARQQRSRTSPIFGGLGRAENKTENLLGLPNEKPGMSAPARMTAGFLAPITAFQLNIVGPGDSETVVLSSGAGSIEYESPSLLTASTSAICGAVTSPDTTQEQANTEYGSLPAIASGVPKQSFISRPT
jgi:hypothetical protein